LNPTFGRADPDRAQRRRTSRRSQRATYRLLAADTTHHLFLDGPADARERAEAFWRRDPAVEAFRVREPGVDTAWSPHRPGRWLSFEAIGGQAQRVAAFAAAEPALDIGLVWYDGALDYGETVLFRGGAVAGRSDGGYQQLYGETYGEPDHNYDPRGIRMHEPLVGAVVPVARVRA